MLKPMKSPRGTNFERLFVQDRNPNPEGAYDAALTADQFSKIMKFLAGSGVSSTILAELEHVITNSNAELGFDARPRHAPESFASRYPMAMRIGQAW